MNQGNSRGWVYHRFIGLVAVLTLALLLLSACQGGENSSASSANSGSLSDSQAGSIDNSVNVSSNVSTHMLCDQMARVTISERIVTGKTDQYFFTPNHVTIKAGEFISFSNQSDQIHVLRTVPDAGLANETIYRNEDQPLQFTRPGAYTLESQDIVHRATMQVVVLSAAGSTCGLSTPVATITFTGKHIPGRPDQYTFTPKAVSINAGQSLLLLNKTDQVFNFSCKPSANLTEGNLRVNTNEQQVVPFTKAGHYLCSTTEAPTETVAVIVH